MILTPPRDPMSTPTATNLDRQIFDNLPLAQATLSLFSHVLSPDTLDGIFHRHRGRSYKSLVTFPNLVAWMFEALVQHQGSGRQAHLLREADADAKRPCDGAFYGKLRRIPFGLSQGFLHDATLRLEPLTAKMVAHTLPGSLDVYETIILDGKNLKRVAKRLVETRGKPGKMLGGKLLVAYRPQDGLILDFVADPDGETNEAKLVPDLVPRLHSRPGRPKLIVADRLFCALNHFHQFTANQGHFVVRYAKRLSFTRDPDRPVQTRLDGQGRTVIEEWGWLGQPKESPRREVRRITLVRPGLDPIIIVTSLVDSVQYPASDLLSLYQIRWSIESTFQVVTQVFHLDRFISCTAEATVFQAAMCLVLANLVQVVQGEIAVQNEKSSRDLSTRQIWIDLRRQLTALKELVSLSSIVSMIRRDLDLDALRELLDRILGGVWKTRWEKTRNKKPRHHVSGAKKRGAHTSVDRCRRAYRSNQGQSDKM